MWKGALFQLSSTDDPKENLETINEMINTAAAKNVDFIALPETANCISNSKTHQDKVLQVEEEDITLASLIKAAKNKALNILVGSLALKLNKSGHKLINRSFFINSSGKILAKYDKLHMFDACVSDSEKYNESSRFEAGKKAKVVSTAIGKFGLSICYDIRFPYLYRDLSKRGAQILTVPSAFTVPTGKAHWEILLRARAIENGAYVIAPAQIGTHNFSDGGDRKTYGHSMVVDP
ncbi:MAG: carbon-nitrogen hydrolase family protein, partial [Paracoccaceae bacterium]